MPDELKRATAARILIAEDEAIVAEDLALSLRDLGYQIVGTVSTAELAVQLAEESKPDLILMDIRLRGEVDGIQASEQIRSRLDIPVIFLTAYEKEDVLSRAKVTEPYGFLAKPFSFYILQTTIDTALYKHAADKRVKESEQRYRMLVEQSIDGIVVLQGSTIRFVNAAFAKMFGCQGEKEMEGQNFLTFVAPEYRELMAKRGSEREKGEPTPSCYEFTALKKDGTPFAADLREGMTVYQGEKARQGIIRDISERKKAEEALRESEERFRKVFEQGPIGMGIVGTDGRFFVANSRLCQMLGYTEDELTRLTFVDITHPEHVTQDLEAVRRLYAGEIPYYKVEKRYIKKDGDILWGNLTAAAIRDAEGKLLYTLPMIEDITDRKRAEDALRQSQEMLWLALDGANVGTWEWDLTTGKALWSERNHRMLGYEPHEFEPNLKNWKKLIHPDDWPKVSDKLNRHIEGKLPMFEAEYRILNKSGDWPWVQARGKVVAFDAHGKPIRISGIVADITERKKAEEELAKAEELQRTILSTSPVGIGLSVGRNMVWVNDAWKEMFGLGPHDADPLTINARALYSTQEEFEHAREGYL